MYRTHGCDCGIVSHVLDIGLWLWYGLASTGLVHPNISDLLDCLKLTIIGINQIVKTVMSTLKTHLEIVILLSPMV